MATIRVPYLVWRDGRPRWVPGPRLRAKGFKGRDLKDAQGRWLGLEAAIDAAQKLNAEVDAWRESGTRRYREKVRTQHERSCDALYEKWTASRDFLKNRATTQKDYRSKASAFLATPIDDMTFGQMPVAAIAPHHLYAWWEEVHKSRGHSMANGAIAVVRRMFSHAQPKRLNWRTDNPASKLELEGVAPRVVVWTDSEIAHFVRVADGMDLASVADAVIIALHTGQRQSDVLLLQNGKTSNGRAVFKQGKTGARVSVPFTAPLAQRLDAIRARHFATDIVELSRPLVISESTGDRYKSDWFRSRFAAVRRAAAKEEGFASLASKQFLDLRDTAVTRLALAGCTVPEIRAITGHTLETVHKVLKHYLALDDRMAEAAIAKLRTYMAEEGIAI